MGERGGRRRQRWQRVSDKLASETRVHREYLSGLEEQMTYHSTSSNRPYKLSTDTDQRYIVPVGVGSPKPFQNITIGSTLLSLPPRSSLLTNHYIYRAVDY